MAARVFRLQSRLLVKTNFLAMSHKERKWPVSKLLKNISNRNKSQAPKTREDDNFPHIPGSVLVSHVLPFLDRSTYNRLCLASKEVYRASRHLIPPWPQGRCFRVGKLVTAVCFAPDGQTLAVASNHKKIHLWNVQKGLYTKLQGHEKPVTDLVYSPDGKWLASASLSEHTIRLWSVKKDDNNNDYNNYPCCSQIWNNEHLAAAGVCNLLFAPNSKYLAVWGDNGGTGIRIINVSSSTGEMEAILGDVPEEDDDDDEDSSQQRLRVVAYSPDQTTLASCVEGKYSVTFWNEGLSLKKMVYQSSDYSRIAYNNQQSELPLETSATTSIAYTPNGSHLVIGYKDGRLEFWNTQGMLLEIGEQVSKRSYVTNITFSNCGSILACGTGSKLKLFRCGQELGISAPTIDWIVTLKGHSDRIESISFCSDGETIATGADKTIRLWKIPK
jgi:WD40 repeat protein